jgi:hypothetical protein
LSVVVPNNPCSNSNRRSSGDGALPRGDDVDGGDAVGDGDDEMSNSFRLCCRLSSILRWSLREMI